MFEIEIVKKHIDGYTFRLPICNTLIIYDTVKVIPEIKYINIDKFDIMFTRIRFEQWLKYASYDLERYKYIPILVDLFDIDEYNDFKLKIDIDFSKLEKGLLYNICSKSIILKPNKLKIKTIIIRGNDNAPLSRSDLIYFVEEPEKFKFLQYIATKQNNINELVTIIEKEILRNV